jgi:hypothetical protein
MNKGLLILIVLVLGLVGCKSNEIEVYDEGTEIVTRKFGPSDLEKLGGRLMEKLEASEEEWMADMPRLAIVDIRNDTDKPGLNKQPFFDVIETAMFRMKKFDLIDYQNTKMLLEEQGYQRFDAFDNSKAVELGKALRAAYVMWGDVSVSSDVGEGGRAIKRYRLSLRVTEVETHRIVYRDYEAAQLRGVK